MKHSVHILFLSICFICWINIFLNLSSNKVDTGRSRLPAFPLVYALESSKIKISRGNHR